MFTVAVLCGPKWTSVDGIEGQQTTQGICHSTTTPARTTTTPVSHQTLPHETLHVIYFILRKLTFVIFNTCLCQLYTYLYVVLHVSVQLNRSRVVFSKQPKLELTQELSSRISESTTGYTFILCVGSFTSPDIDTR